MEFKKAFVFSLAGGLLGVGVYMVQKLSSAPKETPKDVVIVDSTPDFSHSHLKTSSKSATLDSTHALTLHERRAKMLENSNPSFPPPKPYTQADRRLDDNAGKIDLAYAKVQEQLMKSLPEDERDSYYKLCLKEKNDLVLQLYDRDHDGKLSDAERGFYAKDMQALNEALVKDALMLYDTNNDGVLDTKEMEEFTNDLLKNADKANVYRKQNQMLRQVFEQQKSIHEHEFR